ncbi:MAG: hypothetical protein ACPHYI_08050, partial [Candidatus Puniceispirillaceae bacterium]
MSIKLGAMPTVPALLSLIHALRAVKIKIILFQPDENDGTRFTQSKVCIRPAQTALSTLESEKQKKGRIALASNGTLCDTGPERQFNVFWVFPDPPFSVKSTFLILASMYIYLPIAEISMHIGIIIGLGGGVGFLSGLFGVGGGFLMTP